MCDDQDLDVINQTIRLEVPAAGESKPALKYRLFPPRFERKLGNAAPLYHKALAMAKDAYENDEKRFQSMRLFGIRDEKRRKLWWGDDLPEELSPEAAARFIEDYAEFFTTVDEASLCAECDWGLSTEDFSWYLEDSELNDSLSSIYYLTQFLGIGICYALEQGDLEQALRWTRNLFALAENWVKIPMITNMIIVSGIISAGTSWVDQIIASGQSPNLYWALTQIPRFSRHYLRLVESERNLFVSVDPQLKEIDNPARDEDHDFWHGFGKKFLVDVQGHTKVLEDLVDTREEIHKKEADPGEDFSREEAREQIRQEMLESAEAMFKGQTEAFEIFKKTLYPADPQTILDELPAIKQTILDWGYPPERVERLCAEHLVAIYAVRVHDELFDEINKWFGLDYLTWESFHQGEAGEQIQKAVESYGTQFAQMIADLLHNPYYIFLVNAEQEIDALRVVEAIRLYAAAHDEKLPKKLDKIIDVPIPRNPMTGKPFEYKVEKATEGAIGVLEFTSEYGKKYRYEIRIV